MCQYMMPTINSTPNSDINRYKTRSEKRAKLSIPLFIRNASIYKKCLNSYSEKKEVQTDNVSCDGARITCDQIFEIGDFLEVSGLAGKFAALAEVRYFESNWDGSWSIGLSFIIKNGSWIVV